MIRSTPNARVKVLVCCALAALESCSSEGSTGADHAPAARTDAQTSDPTAATKRGVLDFDRSAVGTAPPGWTVGATHQRGPLASWQVASDPTAPSKPSVLSLVTVNHESPDTFNLCWNDRIRFLDGSIAVALKANAGVVDQGGGPIWRAKDAQNYYICRANPLEKNLRVYCVKDGLRRQLASADIEMSVGTWHSIRIEHRGDHIECSFDGKKLLDVRDATLVEPGSIGVWTKADALTSFDDIELDSASADAW